MQFNSGLGAPSLGVFRVDNWEQKAEDGSLEAICACFNYSHLPLFLLSWKLWYRWMIVFTFLILGCRYNAFLLVVGDFLWSSRTLIAVERLQNWVREELESSFIQLKVSANGEEWGLMPSMSHDTGAAPKYHPMDAQIAAFKTKYSFSICSK